MTTPEKAPRLAGRHAVVTGASRGIGAAIAAALTADGVRVSLLGRDTQSLQRVSDSLGGREHAHPIVADITDPKSVESAFAAARGPFGPVHVSVNNAGQAASAKFTETDESLWNRLMAVNLTGTFSLGTRQAVPDMLAAGFGQIVNIASTAGLRGAAYISAYATSKPRRHRPDALARPRIRHPQHHRECHLPGLREYRHREIGHRQYQEQDRPQRQRGACGRWLPPIRNAG